MTADRDTTAAEAEPPWWREARWWRRAALTYAVAIAAGFLASRVSIPLPWMLGPFFVCGILAATGVALASIPLSRELGQLAIGLAVGLRFTPATLLATLSLFPAMLAATVYVMAYTMAAAFFLRPLAGTNPSTAFFATAAGGVADMAIVAREKGGDSSSVAMVHALRVSSTVAIVPILVVTFGRPGTADSVASADGQGMIWLAVCIALALGVVRLLKRTPLPNPWLVGPMFLGIALGASGAVRVVVPPVLIVVAQVFIGTWLGTRFRREVLATLPRVALSGVVVSVFMILAAFVGAGAMAAVTSLPVTTAFLALAPAAVTEMVITATAMHLDAEIVTAFHVMRIFIVCSTILVVYRVYQRLQGGARGSEP